MRGAGHPAAPARPDDATEPALRGLFDHAGMFPPAAKPLPEALRDAARFPHALRRPGLVGADLVLAWKDRPRLSPEALRAAGYAGPCRLAIVGVPLEHAPDVAEHLATPDTLPHPFTIASLEVHAEGEADEEALRATAAAIPGTPVYLEPRWAPARVAAEAADVAGIARRAGAGLKVRCAGATAVDRPALAAAVVAAAGARVPLKATQGLHHPVPRPGFPHGFLGLLAAVRLRQARGDRFSDADVEACLAEPEVHAFELRDGIAWRGHRVPAADLARLPPFAIGSCSLDEPDDDLMQAFGPPGAA